MNLNESTDEDSSNVFFANFNLDCTALSVGLKNRIGFYDILKPKVVYSNPRLVVSDVLIYERNSRCNLVAMVKVSDPRTLMFKDITLDCYNADTYTYAYTILAVKLNDIRFVVCMEDCMYIQNHQDKENCVIIPTPPNPLGLCILSQNIEKNFLAYPGSSSSGEVYIVDTINTCLMGMIAAHENPLEAMAFNATATKIATASDRGTVIRVFDVIEKTKLHEFLPGDPSCARIYSLRFSPDSNYLSSSSNTETVHIFRLDNMREETSDGEPEGLISYLTNVMVGLLPQGRTAPTSMLCADRAFATVHLPFAGMSNICALTEIEESLLALIVSEQRILYIYNVDSVNGGECVFDGAYNLWE